MQPCGHLSLRLPRPRGLGISIPAAQATWLGVWFVALANNHMHFGFFCLGLLCLSLVQIQGEKEATHTQEMRQGLEGN